MKWLAKQGKLKPAPLAAAAGSLALSTYFALTGLGYLNAPVVQDALKAADDEPRKPPRAGVQAPAQPAPSTLEISQAVLARNMFDSAAGPIPWDDAPPPSLESEEEESSGEVAERPPTPLVDCTSDLRLLASIVAEDSERSIAVIRRGASPAKQVHVGGEAEGATLLLLAATHAYVRDSNGVACRLPLYLTTTPPPPAAPAPAPAPAAEKPRKSKKPPLFSEAELESGITELGPDRYKVSRDMITRGMADAAGVVRGAHFTPETGSERNAGVKISDVAEKSTLHKLGVRSGDVLRTLNGVNLSTPDGMLGAYALLREQKTVTLSVMRDGRPKSITYVFE